MIKKYWFYVVGLLSIAAIGSALIAEHYFYLEPCKMCLKQREAYYAIIILFLVFIALRWQTKIWFFLGVQILTIYGLFYSLWHVGIENKLFSGPSDCSGGLELTNNTTNLKDQIMSKSVVNCEDIIWSMFGLSAATINSLLLFLIFVINAIYLWNNGFKKEKN